MPTRVGKMCNRLHKMFTRVNKNGNWFPVLSKVPIDWNKIKCWIDSTFYDLRIIFLYWKYDGLWRVVYTLLYIFLFQIFYAKGYITRHTRHCSRRELFIEMWYFLVFFSSLFVSRCKAFLFEGVIFRYSLVLLPLRPAGLLWCSVPDLGRLSLKFEQ